MLSTPLIRLMLSLAVSLLVGYVAHRRRALATSGVVGLLVSGTLISYFGGWPWFVMLLAFLISSSMWTLYRHSDKQFLDDLVAKSGPRDIVQAAANVGIPCLIAVLFGLTGKSLFYILYLGSLAAVNADTWASELGTLSRAQPRLITNGRSVMPGTSGGITFLGTGAGVAGSLFVALLGIALYKIASAAGGVPCVVCDLRWGLAVVAGGVFGLVLDSLLGATLQVRYYCLQCQKPTEQRHHRGSHRTEYRGGLNWLNNDWVNFISSLSGALVVLVLTQLI
jgi:uncharacterized protein (TIGR00297 family)